MKNIAVIGAEGKLGTELMKQPNTVPVPWMFENDFQIVNDWFDQNKQVDTVWHVARSCRRVGNRRDHQTYLAEQNGMVNLMRTRARKCRFVYASSKIVYGIDGFRCCKNKCYHDYKIETVQEVAKYFTDKLVGTFNCPSWQTTDKIDIIDLDPQRVIYACTKLSNEAMIKKNCPNHKILRIWDIK